MVAVFILTYVIIAGIMTGYQCKFIAEKDFDKAKMMLVSFIIYSIIFGIFIGMFTFKFY